MAVRTESAKKVTTFDHSGQENGYLLELFKDKISGNETEAYLTVAKPGSFKGYHLHVVRAARYVCLRGKVKVITYENENGRWVRTETVLDSQEPTRMFIPKDIATGLENIGEDEAWLVNYPDPAYDPGLKDEQVEYTQEELEQGIVK